MDNAIHSVNPAENLEARNAVLALLGTTLAQLKEIDKNVVGSSRNISALKTDLKNVFNMPQPQQAPQPSVPYTPAPAAIQPAPPVQPPIVPSFTTEVANNIISRLDTIIQKLDLLIKTN